MIGPGSWCKDGTCCEVKPRLPFKHSVLHNSPSFYLSLFLSFFFALFLLPSVTFAANKLPSLLSASRI